MSSQKSLNTLVIVTLVVVGILGVATSIWALVRWLRPALVPVSSLNLDRFAGSWRTIAALPVPGRRRVGSALRVVHQGGGALQFVHLSSASNAHKEHSTLAVATDRGSRFRLSEGPLGRELVVLAFTPDYGSILLGSPDRKRAVILCRSPSIERAVWRHYRDELTRQGFASSRLRQMSGTRIRLDPPAITQQPSEAT